MTSRFALRRPGPAPALCRDPARDGRRCYLCAGGEFWLLHEWPVGDEWNPASIPIGVWRCACGVVFLHPVPGPLELPERGDWWSGERRRHRRNPGWKRIRQKLTRPFVGSSRARLVAATRRARPAGRLLDVGCGTGLLLALARPTYECVGLEPSPVPAAAARAQGFPVVESTLEAADLEPGSFDVVTMDAVVEHVTDPLAVLRKVHEVLRPGGVVALKTPRFGGPTSWLRGRGWNGFRHGYHTYLFTGRTLGRTLEAAGFRVLRSPRRDRFLGDILILWGRKPG